MLNKMARAKDLELDQLQLRVNATEGESMQGIGCHCTVKCLYFAGRIFREVRESAFIRKINFQQKLFHRHVICVFT